MTKRATGAAIASLVLSIAGCNLTSYFSQDPSVLCDPPGRREDLPCGVCDMGRQTMTCDGDGRWVRAAECANNPYDSDGDGRGNERCTTLELDASCCGELDPDDEDPNVFPGALIDRDGDDRYDTRYCGVDDSPLCTDCDDDDSDVYGGLSIDRDFDTFYAVVCGVGDDCDDSNGERWTGHADLDGDGHVDMRCCEPGTPRCDDCDDDDPRRWAEHADLDGDGFVASSCGGDDCDDDDPRRHPGNTDVDGDSHADDRCCDPASPLPCDDCNDDDPRRWTGHADLDGDSFDAATCGGDDCDDDCEGCRPGGDPSPGDARDHDCSGQVDDLEDNTGDVADIRIVSTLAETGDTRAVAVAGPDAFVAAAGGLVHVDVTEPEAPFVAASLDIGDARDVALWGALVLVATAEGLFVVERSGDGARPSELLLLAGPIETGDSRVVVASSGFAFVGSHEGLYVVDLSWPSAPVAVGRVGLPLVGDVRDVVVFGQFEVWVVAGPTEALPEGGFVVLELDRSLAAAESFTVPAAGARCLATVDERVYLATSEAVYRLATSDVPSFVFETEGASGLALTHGRELGAIVTTDGGLMTFETFAGTGWHLEGGVETSPARGAVVNDAVAYVATAEGLVIARL